MTTPAGRLAATLLILGLLALPVQATTLSVATTGSDTLSSGAINPCTDSTNPCATIGNALSQASSGDTISVAAGAYIESNTISASVTIQGSTTGITTVDGNFGNPIFLIAVSGPVTLNNLMMVNGSNGGNGSVFVENANGALTVNNCAFSNNFSPSIMTNASTSATINSSAFFGNSGGGLLNNGTMTVSNSIFIANGSGFGGGIANYGTMTVSNSILAGNQATYGGGIGNGGNLTISGSMIHANSTPTQGGGIFNNGGTLNISGSTISGNISEAGGGIFNYGPATITNSTLSGNSSIFNGTSFGGGAISNTSTSLAIANSTIFGNSAGAGQGGGINSVYVVTPVNTIIAGNSGGNCVNVNSGGHDLSDDNTCGFGNPGDLNNTNPNLGAAAWNGGLTQTLMPLPGSPAIGAGSYVSGEPATDQRGFSRPSAAGAAIDIGAVQTNYLTVTTLADSTDTTTCTGGATCSLRDALNLANSAGTADVIFDSSVTGTITLASALPTVNGSLNLAGPSASALTLSGINSPGAVLTLDGPVTNLSGLTISDGNGGGIDNIAANAPVLSITQSTISGNNGGGINGGSAALLVSNSTISGNSTSAGWGGGIYAAGPILWAINDTISGNSAPSNSGGGIYDSGGSILFMNTIVANSSSGGDCGPNMMPANGLDHNLDDDGSCFSTGNYDRSISNLPNTNPMLGLLQNNGGPTYTLSLPSGSPALDAGNDAALYWLSTDQRGFPRKSNTHVDMGAFERQVSGPSSTALTSSLNPAVVNQNVTFTATVSNAGAPELGVPTGTVTFMDGSNTLGTVALTSGVATYSTTSLAAGSHTITAVYGGDSAFSSSTSNAVTESLSLLPLTSTAVTSSSNPSLYGTSVTFTATVTDISTGTSGTPTGTVTFMDGSNTLGTGTLNGSGVATYSTSSLTAGSHTIAAVYAGDSNFTTSTGSLTGNPQVVNPSATSTAAVSSANPSVFGQSLTFTATVTNSSSGSSGMPTGTVTFHDSTTNTDLGTGNLNGSGVATYSTSSLAAGSHAITAVYGGDSHFNGSTGSLTGNPQVVSQANTTTAAVSSVNSSFFGQSLTFTATVTDSSSGSSGTPTGTVTFHDSTTNTDLGTGTLNGSGVATYSTSSLAAGSHTISAVYGGDGNFNGSTASLTGNPQVVNQANTTTVVVASANPSVVGQAVILTATVADNSSGSSGTPTGTVTFFDAGTSIGTGTLNGGTATFTTSALSIGSHPISASYGADGNFTGSTGSLASDLQIISKYNTSIAVTSSANPALIGQSVTFTATVTGASGSPGAPTGTVTFFDSGVSVGTGTLNGGGIATFTTSVLSLGNHNISASYEGDGNFNGSNVSLPGNPQVVNQAATSTTLTSSANPVVASQSVTFTATVTNSSSGSPVTPTGTVSFMDGSTTLGTGTLNGSGAATYSTSSLALGSHTITAVYAGDSNCSGSTGSLGTNPQVITALTTTSVTSSQDPSVYGQAVTFTATVTDNSTASAPTGSVQFVVNGSNLGSPVVLTPGSGNTSTAVSPAISSLAYNGGTVGYSVTASYSSTTYTSSSGSLAGGQIVNQDATTTTVTSITPSPALSTQLITLSASVTANSPGGGTPFGTVTFYDGATPLAGGVSLDANGNASYPNLSLSPGPHSITAVYLGAGNYTGSTSGIVSEDVQNFTGTILIASMNPGVAGTSVTFTARLQYSGGTPTGNVTFTDGAATLGTAPVNGGVATFSTSSLAAGSHSITATYNGDSYFAASTSNSVSESIVTALGSSTTLQSQSAPQITFGQTLALFSTVQGPSLVPGRHTGPHTYGNSKLL